MDKPLLKFLVIDARTERFLLKTKLLVYGVILKIAGPVKVCACLKLPLW